MLEEYIEGIRKRLDKELEAKTSFGRNEMKLIFEKVLVNQSAKMLDNSPLKLKRRVIKETFEEEAPKKVRNKLMTGRR